MFNSTLRDIRLAEERASNVASFLDYVHGEQLLQRQLFGDLHGFLSQCPHSIPGLAYPEDPSRVNFDLQIAYVMRWLLALQAHYNSRVNRAHNYPYAYDKVYKIFVLRIRKHAKLQSKARARAAWVAGVRALLA